LHYDKEFLKGILSFIQEKGFQVAFSVSFWGMLKMGGDKVSKMTIHNVLFAFFSCPLMRVKKAKQRPVGKRARVPHRRQN